MKCSKICIMKIYYALCIIYYPFCVAKKSYYSSTGPHKRIPLDIGTRDEKFRLILNLLNYIKYRVIAIHR